MWFTKSRRAQNNEDYETWIVGGVSPTLNAFDNTGDKRATVLILDGTRVDDVRVYDDEITPCLKNRMGTGGNNVPFVAIPIQDGRAMDKKQNGLGIGKEGDPSYTLDQTGSQSVAIPIQGTIIGRQDHNGPQGKGFGDEKDPMYTLDSVSQHGVAHFSFDTQFGSNAGVFENQSPTIKSSQQPPSALETSSMSVRRLTPKECERLMGWPDDHTLFRVDGKNNSDTTRYKMCGNGVASPVAEWIGKQIVRFHTETP